MRIKKFRTNYLSYIRSFDYSERHIDNLWPEYYTEFLTYNLYGKFEGYFREWHSLWYDPRLSCSVTWACIGHQLSQIRAIQIPFCDIERYIQHVDEFTCLEYAVFDLDVLKIDGPDLDFEKYRPMMERCLEFVRLLVARMTGCRDGCKTIGVDHQHHHCNLKQWQRPFAASFCLGEDYDEDYDEKHSMVEEYIQRLNEIMPPLYKPTFLTPHNWDRFLCKADQIDLTHIKHVDMGDYVYCHDVYYEKKVSATWDDIERWWGSVFGPKSAPRILQACRSLRTVKTEIDFEGLFDWAVEERLKAMKSSTPPPQQNVRLSKVFLLCTTYVNLDIVNDTMRAFDMSIEKAKYIWLNCLSFTWSEAEWYYDITNNGAWDQEQPIILGVSTLFHGTSLDSPTSQSNIFVISEFTLQHSKIVQI
ncbi:hypothetical protein BGW42_000662 [Actinomortierella wolfii]|nr:hypothetical protein BGW42_000662 [Actinomortierella wolfii]KAG0244528.1 hypothetical protein BGW41_007291 [Actinomortierella wolfii]